MNKKISFGRQLFHAASTEALLEAERDYAKGQSFHALDQLLGTLLTRSFHGERVISVVKGQKAELSISGLHPDETALIEMLYSFQQQQSRGVWFLPTETNVEVGPVHYVYHFRQAPRFASTSAADEWYKASLEMSSHALCLWALFEPCLDAMLQPLVLRGQHNGSKSRDEQCRLRGEIDALYQNLGFSLASELQVMRYGGGWYTLQVSEQIAAKQRFLTALVAQVRPDTGTRYRAHCLRKLVAQYYQKAKDGERAKRSQVITKAFEKTLVGFFGGDWLAFLNYIGEEPHPDEHIITALAPVQIHAGGAGRAAEVAARMGLPVEEVERMMAAYWQEESSVSPVEQRVDVMRRYWQVFDDLHTRQRPGMKPLWGLVEDHTSFDFYHLMQSPYQPGLYQLLLPGDLLGDIERLWGTVMLPQ